jgi:catechol 2,3-dioxygenase-like lactoylglutathione lyase family enzyme
MISYVTIGTDDLDEAVKFYDPVLAALGCRRTFMEGGWAGYASEDGEGAQVMLCKPHDGQPARAGNGIMVGLKAASEEQVRAFHAAALAAGGTDEGAPGLRPYGEGYYLAYVRDPVGNKLSAFFKPHG